MTYRLELDPKAQKALVKIPQPWQIRINRVLSALRSDPFQGKKLEADLKGYYSIRVWPYRILYTIEKKMVLVYVLKIDHRKDVYR